MANAATIAGLAFSNAAVGVCHALAHAVGAKFKIAHGRANGVFLPHVLRYNASLPSKFMPSPSYAHYVAPEKYAQVGWILGLGGRTDAERRKRLFTKVDELLAEVGIPKSLAECGIPKDEFDAALPEVTRAAFSDPSMRTNPRIPMIMEVVGMLQAAYEGPPKD
jgi:acetaldehyde dehydrogenase/alcohol dehydrogenase